MHIGRRITGLLAGAALLLGLSTTAAAGEVKKGATGDKPKAPAGKKADKRLALRKLHGLEWHDGWKAAVTANRQAPGAARPVFFLRILGDLAGGS